MISQPIEIQTYLSYKLSNADLQYLDFYTSNILGSDQDKPVKFTRSWRDIQDKDDFRKIFFDTMEMFSDKIKNLQKEIQRYRKCNEDLENYKQFDKYLFIIKRFNLVKDSMLDNHTEYYPDETDQLCAEIISKINYLQEQQIPLAQFGQLKVKSEKDKKQNEVYKKLISYINQPQMLKSFLNQKENMVHLSGQQIQTIKKNWQKSIEIKRYKNVFQYYQRSLCQIIYQIEHNPITFDSVENLSEISKSISIQNQAENIYLISAHTCIKNLIENIKRSKQFMIVSQKDKSNRQQNITIKQLKIVLRNCIEVFEQNFSNDKMQVLLENIGKLSKNQKQFQKQISKLFLIAKKQRSWIQFKQAVNKIDIINGQTLKSPVLMMKQLQTYQYSTNGLSQNSIYRNKQLINQYMHYFQSQLAKKIIIKLAQDYKNKSIQLSIGKIIQNYPKEIDQSLKNGLKSIHQRKQKENSYLKSTKHKQEMLLFNLTGTKYANPIMNPNDIQFYSQMQRTTKSLQNYILNTQSALSRFQKKKKNKSVYGFQQFQENKQSKEKVQNQQQSQLTNKIKLLELKIIELNEKLKQSQIAINQQRHINNDLKHQYQQKKNRNIQLQRQNQFLQGQISKLTKQKQRQLKQLKLNQQKLFIQRQLQLKQQKDIQDRKVQQTYTKQINNFSFTILQLQRQIRNLNQQLNKQKASSQCKSSQYTLSTTKDNNSNNQKQSNDSLQQQQQNDKLIRQFIAKLTNVIKELIQTIKQDNTNKNRNQIQKVFSYQQSIIKLLFQQIHSFINQFNKYLIQQKLPLQQMESYIDSIVSMIPFKSNQQQQHSANGDDQHKLMIENNNNKKKQQFKFVSKQQLMTDKDKLEQELKNVKIELDQQKQLYGTVVRQKEQLQLKHKENQQSINKMTEQIVRLKCQLQQKSRLLQQQLQNKRILQNELKQYRQKIKYQVQQVSDKNNINTNKDDDHNKQTTKLHQLEGQLYNLKQQNQLLLNEKQLINKKCAQIEQYNQQTIKKLEQLQRQKSEYQQRIRQLSQEITKVTQQKNQLINSLQLNNQNNNNELFTQRQTLFNNQIAQLQAENNLLSEKINLIQHQNKQLTTQITQKESKLNQLENNYNQQNEQNKLLITQNSQLTLSKDNLKKENNQLLTQNQQQKTKIKSLTVELQTIRKQYQQLRQQYQQLKSSIPSLNKNTIKPALSTNKSSTLTTTNNNTNSNSNQIIIINNLKSQLQSQRKQHKQAKAKIIGLQYDLQLLQQDKSKLKNKLKSYQQQIQKLKNQIQLSKQNQQLLIKQKILQAQNQLSQKLISRQSQLRQQYQQKLNQLNLLQQKQLTSQSLKQQQITKLTEQLQTKSQLIQNLINKISSLQQRIIQLKNDKQKLSKQLTQIKKSHQKQIKQLKLQHSRGIQAVKKQYNVLQFKQKLSQNNTSNNNNVDSLSVRDKMEFEKVKSQLQKQKTSHKKSIQTKLKQIQTLKSEITQLKQVIKKSQRLIDQQKHQINTYQQIVKQVSKGQQNYTPNGEKPNIKQNIIFDRFFAGYVMQDQLDKKYQLLNLIQQKVNKKVQKTRLLYKYDLKNSNNFHNYTDGYDNFLLIVRTTKNIFGVFSTSRLQKGYIEPKDTKAFIFTFSDPEKIKSFDYSLKKSKGGKTLTFDEFFLVVGNSEIRLRFGQKIVYSNFAINNAFYETNGANVSALLMNKDSRQADLVGYECFQVIFE